MFPHQIQMFSKCGQYFWIMSDSPYSQHFHLNVLINKDTAQLCALCEEWSFLIDSTLCEKNL